MLRLLVIGALAAVASACGSESFSASEAETVREAAARSARVETVTRTSDAAAYDFRTTGVIDYKRDRSTFVTEAPHTSRTISIGRSSYSQAGPVSRFPPGKQWVRAVEMDSEERFEESQRMEEESEGDRVSFSSIILFDSAEVTPTGYMDYLRALGLELEQTGYEDIRGVPTTGFRTKLSSHRQARHDLEAEGWKQTNIDLYLETLVDTVIDVQVWVDGAAVVRRLVETTKAPDDFGPPGFEPPTTVTTREFFDFGVDVEIEAPPDDEVIEWDEWARLVEEQEPREDALEGIFPASPLDQILPDE